jgi:hypothetical protein
MYDYITNKCRKQAEAVQNRLNANARATGRGETTLRKQRRLKLEGGQAYDRSSGKKIKT